MLADGCRLLSGSYPGRDPGGELQTGNTWWGRQLHEPGLGPVRGFYASSQSRWTEHGGNDVEGNGFGRKTYVLAVNMDAKAGRARFALRGFDKGTVQVLDESRSLALDKGIMSNQSAPYQVHLYEIGN
jgi:hypothetical protein